MLGRVSDLPTFRYHPDPVATGSIIADRIICCSCGEERSHRYTLPMYGVNEVGDLCPWCIADGSSAARFEVTFNDAVGHHPWYNFYDDEEWPDPPPAYLVVPDDVVDEIRHRTPSYSSWQDLSWLSHCNDAAAYRGRLDSAGLRAMPELEQQVRQELGLPAGVPVTVDPDGDLLVHWFRCLHCGEDLAQPDVS
jgi:uncharacterized protein